MNSYNLLFGHCLNTERIGVSQVRLIGKGDFLKVLGGLHSVYAERLILFAVVVSAFEYSLNLSVNEFKLFLIYFH